MVTEHFLDHQKQLIARVQLALGATRHPRGLRVVVGTIGGVVAISITVAPYLPADGGWCMASALADGQFHVGSVFVLAPP